MKKVFHSSLRRSLMGGLLLLASPVLAQEEKPLLTIGCISDFHNSSTLINVDNPNDMRMRGSLTKTCLGMYPENIDLMLIGGDCTSESDLTLEMFNAQKQLLRRTTATAFQNPDNTPVLITTGNHDYEAAHKDANGHRLFDSGDYYTGYMELDVGELTAEDSYFETGTHNGGSMLIRAAYHYKVKGFDFISLNCGKHEFESSWNYEYSSGAVNWVARKLEQITKDDPDKTIFFFLHIPFSDSNSIRYENKGIRYSPTEYKLRTTLAKYPNLIMLYGHDHGSEKAYSRRSTAQRVTLYNTDGDVIPTFDETHVEGPTTDPQNDYCNLQQRFYLQNVATRRYITKDSSLGIALDDSKHCLLTFIRNAQNNRCFTVSINEQSLSYENDHLHEGIASDIYLFRVESLADGKVVAKLADTVESGETYLLTVRNGRYYYALTNKAYSGDNRNLAVVQINGTGTTIGTEVTFDTTDGVTAEDIAWIVRDDASAKRYYIKSVRNGRYLNSGDNNLSTITNREASACTVRLANDDEPLYNIEVRTSGTGTDGGRNVRSGTGGNFSLNKVGSDFLIYRIDDPAANPRIGRMVTTIEDGGNYALVARNKVDPNKWYLLACTENTSTHRMESKEIVPTQTIAISSDTQYKYVWNFEEVPENLTPSFFSAFMGSMRHYLNVADTDMAQTNTPDVVQALMIYVYEDRVVLQMKNYNKSGKLASSNIKVNEQLASYTHYRTVRPDDTAIKDRPAVPTAANQTVYDLQGRTVTTASRPGIYIVNGRKVVR